MDGPSIATINTKNGLDAVPYDTMGELSDNSSLISSYRGGYAVASYAQVPEVISGNGRVYTYFRSSNYELPIIIGKSQTAYVSGVYALDENGSLLWNKTVSVGASDMNVVR